MKELAKDKPKTQQIFGFKFDFKAAISKYWMYKIHRSCF